MKEDILKREKHIIKLFKKQSIGVHKFIPLAEKVFNKIKRDDWYHGIWNEKEVKDFWINYHAIGDSVTTYTGMACYYNSKEKQDLYICLGYIMRFFTINATKEYVQIMNIDEILNYS